MKHLMIVMLALALTTSAAAADRLTVKDGGFEITVSYGDHYSSVRKDNFEVTGTGKNAREAVSIANKKTAQRHQEFNSSLDKLLVKPAPVTKVVEKYVPVYTNRNVYVPVHVPTYRYTPYHLYSRYYDPYYSPYGYYYP